MLCQALVSAGFAQINSDAGKVIKHSITEVDLDGCFFIAVDHYDFSRNNAVNNRLIRLALSGVPVFLGSRNVPNTISSFCNLIFPEDNKF